MPQFPVGGTDEDMREYSDKLDSLIFLSKGGEAFGTEDISLADQSQKQRDANGVTMGLVLQTLSECDTTRERLRATRRWSGIL